MKQHFKSCIAASVVTVVLGSAGVIVGTGHADAARVPTVALTTSGNSNWQVTFDRGAPRPATGCRLRVGAHRETLPADVTTATVRGDTVRPGIYPVSVRCGALVSPTVHLFAPRNQPNDLWTMLSNSTTGIVGY